MKWTNIEKKWHEMARRLQNAAPVKPKDTRINGDIPRGDQLTSPLPDAPGIRDVETRAMA